MIDKDATNPGPSLLANLRTLIPARPTDFSESLRIAEHQAARLLTHFGVRRWPVPETMLFELPRLVVEQRFNLPTSGCCFWETGRRAWIVQINATEPYTRQRFTLLHEYKHIIDHGRAEMLYGNDAGSGERAERAADFFAGCALMPRTMLKSAWAEGIQTVAGLAQAFQVSPQAVTVRLNQTGVADVPGRRSLSHGRLDRAGRLPYQRQMSLAGAPL